jgi:hypothetical protein
VCSADHERKAGSGRLDPAASIRNLSTGWLIPEESPQISTKTGARCGQVPDFSTGDGDFYTACSKRPAAGLGRLGPMEPAFSQAFIRQAVQEADRLAAEAAQLRQEAARHEHEARRKGGMALTLEQRVRELRSVLDAESPPEEPGPQELRGHEVRDTAVEVLMRHRGNRTPIHYRQWYELVEREGFRVAGRKPLATFLTQIRRSPVVDAVPDRPGFYVVDPESAAAEAVATVRTAEATLGEAYSKGRQEDAERARRSLARAERTLLDVARWQDYRPASRPLALVAGGPASPSGEFIPTT